MMNLPGGHQQSLMPATSRSSPAFEPLKAGGTIVLVGPSPRDTDSTCMQTRTPDASRASEQSRLAKDITISPQSNAQARLPGPLLVSPGAKDRQEATAAGRGHSAHQTFPARFPPNLQVPQPAFSLAIAGSYCLRLRMVHKPNPSTTTPTTQAINPGSRSDRVNTFGSFLMFG